MQSLPEGFYGQLRKRADVSGIGLTETVYPSRARLPLHAHTRPYFCLVLRGSYEEITARQNRSCRPAMLIFHPAGEAHANEFGDAGGSCFNLEFGAPWTERIRTAAPWLDSPAVFTDPAIAALATRVRHEFHLMDNVSALAIESLALEMVVAATRQRAPQIAAEKSPFWLKQAEELIRDRFHVSLTLGEIAAAIDRHPVHLAREFRRHHGCTIGDFIRKLRIQDACRRLTTTDESLVRIALACGFSGQAHFSTFVKRATGLSPRRYREAFRVR